MIIFELYQLETDLKITVEENTVCDAAFHPLFRTVRDVKSGVRLCIT